MADYTLPAILQGEWTTDDVGVPGGWEQYQSRTVYDDNGSGLTDALTGIDNTGATDVQPAINAVLAAATANTVVVIPNGTYRCDGALEITYQDSNITFRGESRDGVILDFRNPGGRGLVVGTGESYTYPNDVVSGTVTQGTTSITVADGSLFPASGILYLKIGNRFDEATIESLEEFWGSTSGADFVRSGMYRLVSKASNVLTIEPGLPMDATGLAITASYAQLPTTFCGVENMTIQGTNSSLFSLLEFTNAYGCWAYNVKLNDTANYHLFVGSCVRCTMEHVDGFSRSGVGSNGAGFLCTTSTSCLLWNCIFGDIDPLIEVNQGAFNNVIAFNAFVESLGNSGIVNHGPHNSHNLYEGNVTTFFKSDGYFGGSSRDTFFRNLQHGTEDGVAGGVPVTMVMNRWTRQYYLVGNQFGLDGVQAEDTSMGQPNIGGAPATGTAEPSQGDMWSDFSLNGTLTTRTSDTAGVITLPGGIGFLDTNANGHIKNAIYFDTGEASEVVITGTTATTITFTTFSGVLPATSTACRCFSGPLGWQELDLDVENSTVFANNYHCAVPGPGAIENAFSVGTTLGVSMFSPTAPAWWPGTMDYPPFGADINKTWAEAGASQPALYRYINGNDPPESGGVTITVANVTNFNIL